MTTDKQKASNKQNAKNSTGPRTDAGKQRSSQNALKHGVYAVDSVIPGEDPADFDKLCDEFGQRYLTRRTLRTIPRPANGRHRMAHAPHHASRSRLHQIPVSRIEHSNDYDKSFIPTATRARPESLLRGRALQTRTIELQRFARYEATPQPPTAPSLTSR